MKVVQVNYAYAPELADPDQLLDSYHTLTGWSAAVRDTGASVVVVQAFHRDVDVRRDGIEYLFRGGRRAVRVATSLSQRARPLAFARDILAANPDVVHLNSLEYVVELWQLRRALAPSQAIVVQDHAGGVPRSRSLFAPLRRRMLRSADGFLFTSAAQSQPWRDGRFISSDQRVYEVLESSTSLSPLDREAARSLASLGGRPAVLWVGRLNPTKDPLTVLDGFEKSLAMLPEAVLTMIYSSGELLESVRRRVSQSAALSRTVRLVGAVPHQQLAAYYSAADLFVLGSRHEGSGYALLEACACGTIPVVTDIPSFRAITHNGSVGALWPAGDDDALAGALIGAAHADSVAWRERVSAHFDRALSWRVVGRQARAIYEDVRSRR